MVPSLESTIDAVIPDWPALTPPARAVVAAHCIGSVRAQLRRAPVHIRAGFSGLFAAYQLYVLLRAGPFPSRPACRAALSAFSDLPLAVTAALERLLRSMTLLSFLEDPIVLAALGEETPAARQITFRAGRAQMEGTSP